MLQVFRVARWFDSERAQSRERPTKRHPTSITLSSCLFAAFRSGGLFADT